ncbi:MAG: branched-chain amino acid ABC transporter permease, partial [Roseiarcus sp.]
MSAAAAFKITRATPESRIAALVGSIVVVGLAAVPLWLDRNVISIAGQMLVYVGLASLWNLLAGYGGLVSVGQQAYVGMGAYLLFAGGILFGVPPLLAVPLAGLAAGLVALPVSVLVFRLRGAYFAIGTWVVAEV